MAKTKIEWCDHTVNPVKGLCPVACSYCYGRRLYKRFGWDPTIRYEDPFWQVHLMKYKKPSRVFVGSTMELFGPWIRPSWMHSIMNYCRVCPQHTFIFLTKKPENLAKWKFPENCWVGTTATNNAELRVGLQFLNAVDAKVRFASLEPLLSWNDRAVWDTENRSLTRCLSDLDLIIIGQQTPVSKATTPKLEWIAEIVEAADKEGVKIFLKDNLRPVLKLEDPLMGQAALDTGLLNWAGELRQEFPA